SGVAEAAISVGSSVGGTKVAVAAVVGAAEQAVKIRIKAMQKTVLLIVFIVSTFPLLEYYEM
ncbi:MAG: hypothetical protein GYA12_14185, partial [Chloroflexi bacterium]|nr:hypothetical protein [Chloroflexota bacterium]